VIAIWIASIALLGGIAAAAGGGFVNNFSLPGSESQKAVDLLEEKFPEHSGDSDQIVFHATKGTLSDPADRQAISAIVKRVERFPSVAGVESPLHAEGQISQDGKIGFATLLFDKQATSLDKDETKEVVEAAQAGATPDLEVQLGGRAVEQAESAGTGPSELIGVGVAIIVLIVVLGSGAAMTMPLLMAFAAIGLAMTIVLAASSGVSCGVASMNWMGWKSVNCAVASWSCRASTATLPRSPTRRWARCTASRGRSMPRAMASISTPSCTPVRRSPKMILAA